MNTWHGLVVPKLKAKGVMAWFDGTDWFLDETNTENVWQDVAPYAALTEYLEAQHG